MKFKLALLALIAATSMIAQAQTATKSRADCSKEAIAAMKAGDIECGEKPAVVKSKSTKSRAAVKTEAKAAVKAGEIGGDAATPVAKSKSTKSRVDCSKEAIAAMKAGDIECGDAPKK